MCFDIMNKDTDDSEISRDDADYKFYDAFDNPGPMRQIRRIPFFKINFIMFLISFFWVSIFFIVPAVLPADSVDLGDDGVVGKEAFLEDNDQQIKEINNSFAEAIYNFGDSSCHQLNHRSYFINGNQMPLCARDIGIYLGFAIGALIVTFFSVEMRMWWILGSLVPIGVDGLTQMFTSYESTNPVRLITGGLAGIMTTMVMGIMIYEIYITGQYKKQQKQHMSETPPAKPLTNEKPLDEKKKQEKPEEEMDKKEKGKKE
jgi:uncharacterized membrane protein